jgi:hypothetical protein
VVLYSAHTHNKLLASWVPVLSSIPLTLVGQQFTGPSLNPFYSFSWYWHFQVGEAAAQPSAGAAQGAAPRPWPA